MAGPHPTDPHEVVLITGASSGIGAAVARAVAADAAAVGLMARGGNTLAALAAELGSRAATLVGDVTRHADVTRALDRLEAEAGPVTRVINCAGTCSPVELADLDPAAWREVIDVNLTGTFLVAREAGLRMRHRGGGSIVNVGSELGTLGASGYVAYCASKAGVIGLTRALAVELAPTVRVNAVCPGPVDTPMLDAEFSLTGNREKARDETERRVPLRRIATADEVAGAIVFLAGCTYASGSALALDGGTTIAI
jgi:NAD(P)-dependent dehydrogenase (short-subunit alcohol dehydrogenase family)